MTTKERCLQPIGKQQTFINDFTGAIQSRANNNNISTSWKTKFEKDLPSNDSSFEKKRQKKKKQEESKGGASSNTKTSSTLSLHIAAYENSLEVNNQTLDTAFLKGKSEQGTMDTKLKGVKQLESSSQIQDQFEIPRQQTDKSMKPEVMQFKASQKLLNPNESISLSSNEDKEKMKFSKDEIFASMVDTIYMLTAQPINYQKLINFFTFVGQPYSLEYTCQHLVYHSLNHLIRENAEIFSKFLEIYASKDTKKDDPTLTITLYYKNKDLKAKGLILENLQDREIEDGHVQIQISDTVFFETHNELQYIQGRKKVAQAVNYCIENRKVNSFGYVSIEQLQTSFEPLFDEAYSNKLLKSWFPNQGKMDQILQNILFEEIDYLPPNSETKQGFQFRLKVGLTIEHINAKLDELQQKIQPFMRRLEDGILRDANSRRRSTRNNGPSYRPPPPQKPQPRGQPSISTCFKPKKNQESDDNVFGESDSDQDDRVENRPYAATKQLSTENFTNFVGEEAVAGSSGGGVGRDAKRNAPSPKPSKPPPKDASSFIQQYPLANDLDLIQLFGEVMKEKAKEEEKEGQWTESVEEAQSIILVSESSKQSKTPQNASLIIPDGLFLNPSGQCYNESASYTDSEDDEEEEEEKENESDENAKSNDSSPIIASKPSSIAAANINQTRQSSSSESIEGPIGDVEVKEEDLINISSNMPNNNGLNNSENSRESPPSPKPSSSTGDQSKNKTSGSFEWLRGGLPRSQEPSKFKKEEHRRQREKANQTDLKKQKQFTHSIEKPVAHHPPPAARTMVPPPSSGLSRIPEAAPPVPPVVESRQASSRISHPPEPAPRSSPFNNSQFGSSSNVPRDRPHNYRASPANPAASVHRPVAAADPRSYDRNRSSTIISPPPVSTGPVGGGFRPPHNLPKPDDHVAQVQHHPTERRMPENSRQEIRPPPRQVPLPQTPSPDHRARESRRNPPPPSFSHPHDQQHPQYRGDSRQMANEFGRNENPQPQSRARQYSENSIDSEVTRRRPRHDYFARPDTAAAAVAPQPTAADYGNHHHHQQHPNNSISSSEAGFRSLSLHPQDSEMSGHDEGDEFYEQQHYQSRNGHQQNWNDRDEAYPRTPQPSREEYLQHTMAQQEPAPPPLRQYYPPEQPLRQQIPTRQQYPVHQDDATHYAIPQRISSLNSGNHYPAASQDIYYPSRSNSRMQQQQPQNYYSRSEYGYGIPSSGTRSPYQHQSQQQHRERPVSAFPHSTSLYQVNPQSRPLSVNPGDYYRTGPRSGSSSVIPRGSRQRLEPTDASIQNEVNEIIKTIRSLMVVREAIPISKIGYALGLLNLPTHPQYINGLNIDNWTDFLNEYLPTEVFYEETHEGQFLVAYNP